MNPQDPNVSNSSNPLPEPASHRVHGRITTTGAPVAGAAVQAFEIALRSESLLGSATTDAAGQYEIRYPVSSLHPHTDGSADLAVKVAGVAGWLPTVSSVWYNAPADAEVNLTLTAASVPTGLEAIEQRVTPLLEGMRVENLAEDGEHQDLTFLAGDTGLNKATLFRFVLAHQLAQESPPRELWFALLGSGALRIDETQDLAAQREAILNRLSSLDAATVRKALARSWNSGEISESLREKEAEWIENLLDFAASRAVGPDAPMTLVKAAVAKAGIHDGERKKQFARLLSEHRGLTPAMLASLQNDPSFTAEEIDDLRTSFQLADLTQSDFSVVQKIREDFSVHQPEDVHKLAKMSESEWVQWVVAGHAAGALEFQSKEEVGEGNVPVSGPEAEKLGKELARRFRQAFSTAAFAGGLARALQSNGAAASSGGVRGLRHAQKLSEFLESHPGFDLLRTSIDDFLKNHAQPQFLALAQDDEGLKLEMKAVQRVFKLAPTFEATETLLADDLHSAQKIYRMGETQFVRTFADRPGFTVESARRAWNRAAETHAAVLTIVGDLKSLEAESLPMVLKSSKTETLPATFPHWNDLFQAGDLCECEHCRSLFSPAAYFADLLLFLKDRDAKKKKKPAATEGATPDPPPLKAKDVLFSRRPDLGYLELNCANASTPLPYVDVVCEVLEAAIAGEESDAELANFPTIPTDDPRRVADKLAAVNPPLAPLGTSFTLTQIKTEETKDTDPQKWVVHGDEATYLLKQKTAGGNFFAELLRNTKASAEELAAYPQYVNPKAYGKLSQAKYPMTTLPMDLPGEEVRAAMQKANLRRWELMRTLRGPEHDTPTDSDIAAEYFAISAAGEKGLILSADTTDAGQRKVWGEKEGNPTWLDSVAIVKNFLAKTKLEYTDLLALLDLQFINPAGDVTIQPKPAPPDQPNQDKVESCDLDKKILTALSAEKLDRIHRFLRLWRKLPGWQMWELDLAIRRLRQGVLGEELLIDLFYLCELRNRWGGQATVEQMLALFGELSTETYFTRLHEKRADGLYQSLFLNRRIFQPLDPAFEVAKVKVTPPDLPTGKISAHRPAVLAALNIREADLALLTGLHQSDGKTAYINDDLTLTNLSFLWRHVWLAKSLRLKLEEWVIVLEALHQDVSTFASPRAALEYLENVDYLKAAGFTPDELNWLLAADRTAKAAVAVDDAAKFLLGLRKELQAVRSEFAAEQYDFLVATPPADEAQLTALLTTLLQKLNRDEPAVNAFLATLRVGVLLIAPVQGLPSGFTFPAAITAAPSFIPIQYDESSQSLRFTGLMTEAQRTSLLSLLTDDSLKSVLAGSSYQNAIADLFQQALAAPKNFLVTEVDATAAPALPPDQPSIPIVFSATTKKLRFIGLMTEAERNALKEVRGNPSPAIDELFQQPRLGVKFYAPVFTAPLAALPAAVDFKALPAGLAARITYDAEERVLRCTGILSQAERTLLDGLVSAPEQAYHDAIDRLVKQPGEVAESDARVWLTNADLTPGNASDTLAKRLANAARKALTYLSQTSAENTVVQQCSGRLELTAALTRYLLTRFSLPSDTLLKHLTDDFSKTTGVVDYTTLTSTFDRLFWATRVATIWRRWEIVLNDLDPILELTVNAQLIDFLTLPLDSTQPMASAERFARTSRLLRVRENLPESEITLFEVLGKLNAGPIYNGFAADVERLNSAWPTAEVQTLIGSLDIDKHPKPDEPSGYLLAESWERLRRAFDFFANLNAGAAVVKRFAAAVMTDAEARTLEELLCARFGTETWLTMSAEIQNVLRERKRDALTAYLLTQDKTSVAPSRKWESPNDLYAYYLLDVEMGACQQTSRLVQASGSVQLFVQRCFMGLEPEVVVDDGEDGDSGWRWWSWMSRYRLWEANRKVFVWPENYIEPELRKDKSPFFKDLENELMQNEIHQDTVEASFTSYLEKLAGVAHLEIAGFYQEDDGDNTILHCFGRTGEAEPHHYYYRRYDYRQWTSWEKVDLDIQGDYLIPAVMNGRLFLFWPVFTEVPDADGNSKGIPIPIADKDHTPYDAKPTSKKLKLQLAMSEYRNGKWTPKKISKDAIVPEAAYTGELANFGFKFWAVDQRPLNERFTVQCEFGGTGKVFQQYGFEISSCRGVPEKTTHPLVGGFASALLLKDSSTNFLKWEDSGSNDLTFQVHNSPQKEDSQDNTVLRLTPGTFKIDPPWQLSLFDRLLLDSPNASGPIRTGTWIPCFYSDNKRIFFVLPALTPEPLFYYSNLKRAVLDDEALAESAVQKVIDSDITKWSTPEHQAERAPVEEEMESEFPEEPPSPYSNEQLEVLLKRSRMKQSHLDNARPQVESFAKANFFFKNFYHPFACDFSRLAQSPLHGIPALMSRTTQLRDSGFSFYSTYQPTDLVIGDPNDHDSPLYPRENVDFSPDGAYSPYNWELFFHAPLLIADSLSREQRFAEAREWYHFMFNPIGVEPPPPPSPPSPPPPPASPPPPDAPKTSLMNRYWLTKPFFETTDDQYRQQRIENLLAILAGHDQASADLKSSLEGQVSDWRTNPFEPHRIANYRTVAYQKTVVMKYLDNLIAWGDSLFRQDTMESINEATQLYVLAAEILGPRPMTVPPRNKPPLESFNELEGKLDDFASALVQVENLIPVASGKPVEGGGPAPLTLYFCIPQNDKLLGYWDTVADRLYKIRHCMNLDGAVRQLALFAPPIDPAALVKAVAGGVDIGAALADLNAPLPLYRFNVLLQKANEVCNDVKALGGALLTALEKKDAEALGLLRQNQEIRLLDAVKAVRETQLAEAKESLEGVKKSKELAEVKKAYYESREFMNAGETAAMVLSGVSLGVHAVGTVMDILGGALAGVPDFTVGASGFGGSPVATAKTGGSSFSKSVELAARSLYQISTILDKSAGIATTVASYHRRQDEWNFQKDLAAKEIEQLEKSIAAAELRVTITEQELDNQRLQIENAKSTDTFLRSKYTSQELYQWQVGQISGVFFESYKLAYDLAKRAERCFRFELGLQDSSYIQFGYWDSLKKGLLSGEKLQYDLRRLETAYLEKNRREFELTKHVSLLQLDPLALVKLRETGRCFFRLPEELFDLDYPGHYFRRIKSVNLTLPCVAGPYTTISCTLRLLQSSLRINTAKGNQDYPRNTDDQGLPADDPRFVETNVPVQAIAASSAQNDGGVFELSFRDDRYLPFEGAGAISEWSLELFSDLPANNPDPAKPDFGKPLRQFDYSTLSDAILHVKYTAREDAGLFKNRAVAHLRDYLKFHQEKATPSLRLFNLRQEFPTQWSQFLNPISSETENVFKLAMEPRLFPLLDQGKTLKITTIWLLARCTNDKNYTAVLEPPLPVPEPVVPPKDDPNKMTLARVQQYGNLHFSQMDVTTLAIEVKPTGAPVPWKLKMIGPDDGRLQASEVEEVFLVLGYEWE
ncbi:MAG TPA: neuraminidase-like domain-containing protein [Thermoanaerobaculia bacterium]|nr:neuraminidase-like domain-containing protein [Thermoanaerobaculia bacterium]